MAWWEKLGEGIRVVRPDADMLNVPLFTIAVGKVVITLLVGEITEVPTRAAGSVLTQLRYVGAGPPTSTDLCTTTDVEDYAIGDIVGITGVPGIALIPTAAHGSIPGMTTQGVIVTVGTIDLVCAVIPDNGMIIWTLFYRPIDQGANVVAA